MIKDIINLKLKTVITSLFLIIILGVSSISLVALAQDNIIKPETKPEIPITNVKLGVKPIEPFVVIEGDKASGFSIDLWETLSKKLGLTTTETKKYPSVSNLIDDVASSQVDVGIAGISITSDREQKVDFSYPMFKSGLSILTTSNQKNSIIPSVLANTWETITNRDFLYLGLVMLILSVIPAIVIYLTERRTKDGFLDTDNIFYGVFLAYCWCFMGLFGQQDNHPATKSGRFFGMTWLIFGVLFLAFFSAQITANLTTEQLESQIKGIDDLRDKKVSTIKNTTSSLYLSDNKIDNVQFQNLKEAVEAMDRGETVAVIYDKPALDYYNSNNPSKKYLIVGGAFTIEDYGLAFPNNSLLRKKVNTELLKMYQSGEYETLRLKYFGKGSGN